ncbi:hypothetical protein [Phenylobacterium sp.]|uniref:hypothetical protein n=1 Tax=Phenylobacterium sp. TaxID=1871053 RepID=UPI0035B34551
MRMILAVFAAALAGPALAQTPPDLVSQGDLAIQNAEAQAAANRREVSLENRLNAQDAALRAETAVRALQDQSAQAATAIPPPALAGAASVSLGDMASIPDERLAASNARVREAAQNRR